MKILYRLKEWKKIQVKGEKITWENVINDFINKKVKETTSLSKERRHKLKGEKFLRIKCSVMDQKEEKRLLLQRLVGKLQHLIYWSSCYSWRGDRGDMSKHLWELFRAESQSHWFSYLHVKINDIICECQKQSQQIKQKLNENFLCVALKI